MTKHKKKVKLSSALELRVNKLELEIYYLWKCYDGLKSCIGKITLETFKKPKPRRARR